jgi:hypothetical protein
MGRAGIENILAGFVNYFTINDFQRKPWWAIEARPLSLGVSLGARPFLSVGDLK